MLALWHLECKEKGSREGIRFKHTFQGYAANDKLFPTRFHTLKFQPCSITYTKEPIHRWGQRHRDPTPSKDPLLNTYVLGSQLSSQGLSGDIWDPNYNSNTFFYCCDKKTSQKYFTKEGFVLFHSLRLSCILAGKLGQWKWEAAGHRVSTAREKREVGVGGSRSLCVQSERREKWEAAGHSVSTVRKKSAGWAFHL